MSLAAVLTQLKRADGIGEHSMSLMLEQQRNFSKLFSAWHRREKSLILPNPHSDVLAREASCTVSGLGQSKGIFSNHLPKWFNRQQFQSSESVWFEAWLMRYSVRGIQRLQRCRRLGVERVFKLWILVRVLELYIVIWNCVIIVCFNEKFTRQISLRLTAQLPNLGIKNASVRNLQPKTQYDIKKLFHKKRSKEWRGEKEKKTSGTQTKMKKKKPREEEEEEEEEDEQQRQQRQQQKQPSRKD